MISLVMNHHLSNEYKLVVDKNQQWTEMHEYVDAMGVLVSVINAPGNDIFDSKNVRFEKTRAKTAFLVYQSKKDEFIRQISLMKSQDYKTQLLNLAINWKFKFKK